MTSPLDYFHPRYLNYSECLEAINQTRDNIVELQGQIDDLSQKLQAKRRLIESLEARKTALLRKNQPTLSA